MQVTPSHEPQSEKTLPRNERSVLEGKLYAEFASLMEQIQSQVVKLSESEGVIKKEDLKSSTREIPSFAQQEQRYEDQKLRPLTVSDYREGKQHPEPDSRQEKDASVRVETDKSDQQKKSSAAKNEDGTKQDNTPEKKNHSDSASKGDLQELESISQASNERLASGKPTGEAGQAQQLNYEAALKDFAAQVLHNAQIGSGLKSAGPLNQANPNLQAVSTSLESLLGQSAGAKEGSVTLQQGHTAMTSRTESPSTLNESENLPAAKRAASTSLRHLTDRAIEQVEKALEEAAKSKDGKTISLRLDPPELGRVTIDVSLRDGGLHARLSAERDSLVHALRERVQELHRILRGLGLEVQQITVSIRDHETSSQGDLSSQREYETERDSNDQFDLAQGAESRSEKISGDTTLDHWIA